MQTAVIVVVSFLSATIILVIAIAAIYWYYENERDGEISEAGGDGFISEAFHQQIRGSTIPTRNVTNDNYYRLPLKDEVEELDSVLEFVNMAPDTELAVVGYVYEPDLKVVVKVCNDSTGLSQKAYKRAVRFKRNNHGNRIGYITMNNRHYILKSARGK